MSDKPEAAEAKPPAKSRKKLLIIGGVVLLLLALAAGGAFFYISKQRAAAAEEAGDEPSHAAAAHVTPPVYLPMDNMVVNLADPGGDRVAQIGITLVLADAHATDTVKGFLPSIRSGVLMLISQRTAAELLSPEGKEALKKDVLREASLPFGGGDDASGDSAAEAKAGRKSKKAHADVPVTSVLFSSFIVQ